MRKTIIITIVAVAVVAVLSVFLTKIQDALMVPDTQPVSQPAGYSNIKLSRAEMRTVLQDLYNLFQNAFILPFHHLGELQGYRIMRVPENSSIVNVGLQQDDVIASLAGSELKSPELVLLPLSQLDNISAISIDIFRNNEKKTLFVEIQ